MYSVNKITNKQYGNVIQISRTEISEFKNPFQAVNKALTLRRLWIDATKIRFLIDGQIMSKKDAERWSNEEYKFLPKCENCATILVGKVYNHSFSGNNLFCSQSCADKNYLFKMEKLDEDERECDFR